MTDDNDARFLITNAVMPRLDNLDKNVGKIFDRIDAVCTTNTDLKITDEMMKAKISSVEMMNANTQRDIQELKIKLDTHQSDNKTHYNANYNETFTEKMWRKKAEIVVASVIGSATGIIALLKANGVI